MKPEFVYGHRFTCHDILPLSHVYLHYMYTTYIITAEENALEAEIKWRWHGENEHVNIWDPDLKAQFTFSPINSRVDGQLGLVYT